MSLATTQGREAALVALDARRKENLTRVRVRNEDEYAGSPMHFDCITCGADIVVPESYVTRPQLCRECQAMKDAGWLE